MTEIWSAFGILCQSRCFTSFNLILVVACVGIFDFTFKTIFQTIFHIKYHFSKICWNRALTGARISANKTLASTILS